MAENNENEIVEKLEVLIRLTAIGLCEGKNQKDQILLLSSAGITPKEIASMLNTTSNTVSVTLAKNKKGK